MQVRYWYLPGGITAKEALEKPTPRSLFWYCYQCATTYAEAWVETDGKTESWVAISGCCPSCPGNKWVIPGSLETVQIIGDKLPDNVIRYQFDYEMKFLRSPYHPYNEKELEVG